MKLWLCVCYVCDYVCVYMTVCVSLQGYQQQQGDSVGLWAAHLRLAPPGGGPDQAAVCRGRGGRDGSRRVRRGCGRGGGGIASAAGGEHEAECDDQRGPAPPHAGSSAGAAPGTRPRRSIR